MALGVHRAVSIDTHVHGGKEQGGQSNGDREEKAPKGDIFILGHSQVKRVVGCVQHRRPV